MEVSLKEGRIMSRYNFVNSGVESGHVVKADDGMPHPGSANPEAQPSRPVRIGWQNATKGKAQAVLTPIGSRSSDRSVHKSLFP